MSKNTNEKFTVSGVIDALGVNKFTWSMFAFLGFAMLFDGYDLMVVNVSNMAIAHTFWPDNPSHGQLMGSLTTWGLLGMVLGGAVGGILSDKFGRKKMLVIAIAFYSAFTFPQAFATDLEFFAVFRVLAGFGIGSCVPIVTTTFSETMPSKRRGLFITFGMAFVILGWVVAGLIGNPITNAAYPIIPGFTEEVSYVIVDAATGSTTNATMYANWRINFLIGVIPLLYAVFVGIFMKETPHWFANSGRTEKAIERLAQIERKALGVAKVRDSKLLLVPPKPEKTNPTVLLSRRYIMATIVVWSCYFLGQFCSFGMLTWLPTWFVGIGYSASDAITLQTLTNVAAVIATISVGFISDTIGRKRSLVVGWLFSIVAIVLCALFVKGDSFFLCIGLMVLFGFALNYALGAVQPIMPESYPTQIRNMGVSWAQAFGRFGGASAPIVLGGFASMEIFKNGAVTNWNVLVLVLIIPLALAFVIAVVFLRRETKGKTMDEIQLEIEMS